MTDTIYPPGELRAQVAKMRALAWQVADNPMFSLSLEKTCAMLAGAAKEIERQREKVARVERVNGALRREIELHQSHAATTPNAAADFLPERTRVSPEELEELQKK